MICLAIKTNIAFSGEVLLSPSDAVDVFADVVREDDMRVI